MTNTEYDTPARALMPWRHRPCPPCGCNQDCGATASTMATPQAIVTRRRGSIHQASSPSASKMAQPLVWMRLCRVRQASQPSP